MQKMTNQRKIKGILNKKELALTTVYDKNSNKIHSDYKVVFIKFVVYCRYMN